MEMISTVVLNNQLANHNLLQLFTSFQICSMMQLETEKLLLLLFIHFLKKK